MGQGCGLSALPSPLKWEKPHHGSGRARAPQHVTRGRLSGQSQTVGALLQGGKKIALQGGGDTEAHFPNPPPLPPWPP